MDTILKKLLSHLGYFIKHGQDFIKSSQGRYGVAQELVRLTGKYHHNQELINGWKVGKDTRKEQEDIFRQLQQLTEKLHRILEKYSADDYKELFEEEQELAQALKAENHCLHNRIRAGLKTISNYKQGLARQRIEDMLSFFQSKERGENAAEKIMEHIIYLFEQWHTALDQSLQETKKTAELLSTIQKEKGRNEDHIQQLRRSVQNIFYHAQQEREQFMIPFSTYLGKEYRVEEELKKLAKDRGRSGITKGSLKRDLAKLATGEEVQKYALAVNDFLQHDAEEIIKTHSALQDADDKKAYLEEIHQEKKLSKALLRLAGKVTTKKMTEEEEKSFKELQAKKDPLTRATIRRAFEDQIPYDLKRFINKGRGVAGFIYFDIDHFKPFNDNYSHAVGDEVLRFVGRTVNGLIRKGDVFVRLGGEEFLVYAEADNNFDLGIIAHRIRNDIERKSIDVMKNINEREQISTGRRKKITVSVGMCFLDPVHADIEKLTEGRKIDEKIVFFKQVSLAQMNQLKEHMLKRADKLLYDAKNNGRNKVVIDTRTVDIPSA